MTSRLALAWAILACPLVALPGERRLADPQAVDSSPTGYACTAETLRTGADCVFEGDPAAPFASTPAQTGAELGEVLCTAAARAPGEAHPDPIVKAACQAEVQRRLRRCADERAVLLDSAGQFLPGARACYVAIGEALALARTQASTVAPCCSCLAEQRCGGERACVSNGPGTPLQGAVAACAARYCADACASSLPLDDDAPPEKRPGSRQGDEPTRQRLPPAQDRRSTPKEI